MHCDGHAITFGHNYKDVKMTPTSLRTFNKFPHRSARTGAVVLSLAILFALASAVTPAAQAQTFNVVYNFPGPPEASRG